MSTTFETAQRHNRILLVEAEGKVLVLQPHVTAGSFRMAEVQVEYNNVFRLLDGREFDHLLFDFHHMEYAGSTIIGPLVTLATTVKRQQGQVAAFGTSDYMLEVYQNMALHHLWKNYSSRAEALASVLAN